MGEQGQEQVAVEEQKGTKINKIVINGFKSFAKHTEILFNDNFNCILGPNGAGKSNILDALCFVLGKSSSKSLRAERAANLIYNGGKLKKRALSLHPSYRSTSTFPLLSKLKLARSQWRKNKALPPLCRQFGFLLDSTRTLILERSFPQRCKVLKAVLRHDSTELCRKCDRSGDLNPCLHQFSLTLYLGEELEATEKKSGELLFCCHGRLS